MSHLNCKFPPHPQFVKQMKELEDKEAHVKSQQRSTRIMERQITTQEAVNHLIDSLKSDPGYWIAWEANIAMAIKDRYSMAEDKSDIHAIANLGAKDFLNLLTRDMDTAEEVPGMMDLAKSKYIPRLGSSADVYTYAKRLSDLENLVGIQKDNVGDSEYMRGMYNGLVLANTVISEPYGAEPKYMEPTHLRSFTPMSKEENKLEDKREMGTINSSDIKDHFESAEDEGYF